MAKHFLKIVAQLALCFAVLVRVQAQGAPADAFAAGLQQPGVPATAWNDSVAATPCSCWFAGADYRLLRTHFSEAVSFATLTPTIGPSGPDLRIVGHELKFDYQSAFAVFAGFHLSDVEDIRFTYTHLDSSGSVGGTAAPGQFIVDPIGNIATPGDTINTSATVRLNVYDLEYIWSPNQTAFPAGMTYSGGLRFADIHQTYRARITGGGATLSDGVFQVGFFGVGPYGSLTGRLWVGEGRTLSLYGKAGGAVLVAKNHITAEAFTSAASPGNVLGSFTAGQDSGRILVAPVVESELGVSWIPTNWVTVSAGYFVQAWTELGISGASFSGARLPAASGGLLPPVQNVFNEADDTSIMGFEGLFVRVQFFY